VARKLSGGREKMVVSERTLPRMDCEGAKDRIRGKGGNDNPFSIRGETSGTSPQEIGINWLKKSLTTESQELRQEKKGEGGSKGGHLSLIFTKWGE